jgi:NADH-quinone oxidoreductase subunit B
MQTDTPERDDGLAYDQPLLRMLESVPGLDVAVGRLDQLLTWASTNSLFIFPMATSCCGIELMAVATARVDIDRMGAIMRGTPRQCDVMVVAGTITVKMAPRVKRLWDQMPEPKWCIAMGSCAISGDFYRDIYSVVPGIDTFLPVDVYVPGCPPNPEALMGGMLRLQEKIRLQTQGKWVEPEPRPETDKMIRPQNRRLQDADRDPLLGHSQLAAVLAMGINGHEFRSSEHHLAATEELGIGQPRNVLEAASPLPGCEAAVARQEEVAAEPAPAAEVAS